MSTNRQPLCHPRSFWISSSQPTSPLDPKALVAPLHHGFPIQLPFGPPRRPCPPGYISPPSPCGRSAGSLALGAAAFSKPTTCQAPVLVDVSGLTKVAKTDDVGLLPQPINPKYKTALVQIYVPSQPFGGSDKSNSGHRYDSIPIANGMIASGMSCQLIHYDAFVKAMEGFDAIIVRCNPGQINAAGGEQTKFDDAMRGLQKKGRLDWLQRSWQTGAKDALCKIANLGIGLPDTFAYYDPAEFAAGFKKTMAAFQPRVIKQNRGSSGEGIWIIKLKSENYCSWTCKNFGDRSCTDDEVLEMMEACDNHSETHTVAEFIEFCVNGRTSKSGKWDTVGTGKYLEGAGGKAAGGQLVDQRFCPRIVEGEVRMNMIGDTCTGIIHKKKPKAGGISAVGGTGSIYTFYGPDAPEFKQLFARGLRFVQDFLKNSIPTLMESLDLKGEPLPLWWTGGDFINADPGKPGTPCTIDKWIVGEFNCSCVGISKCLPAYCNAEKPNASVFDIPVKDFIEALTSLATYLGNLMGKAALTILDGQGAKMSPSASKVLSRIEALRGAAKAGVLSSEEAGSMLDKLFDV
eukprot:Skav206428  [mRNA]  locus=scaffold292:632099:648782:- [translate_table: standard]